MSDEMLVFDDTQDYSQFEDLAEKIRSQQFSSTGKDEDIAYAVGLYLSWRSAFGSSPSDLRGQQDALQKDLEGFLGTDNASEINTYLNLYLNNNAQYTQDRPAPAKTTAGEPVDLATGQFIFSVTDFSVYGAGLDFDFVRTYKSGSYYQGPLGSNWDHAYNLWLRDNGGSVTVTTGRLMPIRYMRHQYFSYYVAIGDENVVMATIDGAFEQRSPVGGVVRFEQVGDADGSIYRAVSLTDRFGNYLRFHYDAQLRLDAVAVNHPARLVSFIYDDQSRIQRIKLFQATYTTQAGPSLVSREWTYTYDDFWDLVAVTGPATDEFPGGRSTLYAYSSASSFPQRQHDLMRVTDANGSTYLENEYGRDEGTVAFGKVVRQRVGSGSYCFEYAAVLSTLDWKFTDVERPVNCVTVLQRNGHAVYYVLNAIGNVLASSETIVTSAEQIVLRRYSYDADGRITGSISPEGRISQFYYGLEDFYRRTVNPGDASLPIWLDPALSPAEHARFGNILAAVQRSRTLNVAGAFDNLSTYEDVFPDILVADADDIVIKRTYEGRFQQLATTSDPRYTISPDPRAPESLDPSSAYSKHLTVSRFNNGAGATPSAVIFPDTTYPAVLPNGSRGVAGARKTFDTYDSDGRLLQWTDGVGNRSRFEYFPADPMTPTKKGFLAASIRAAGDLDLRTSFEVNEAGQIVATSDPLQNTSRFHIDSHSLLRAVLPPIPGYKIAYSYDGNSQLAERRTAIIDPDGTVAPGSPEVSKFKYNDEMSVILSASGDSSGVAFREVRRDYDGSNRLVRLTRPRGNAICYEYDERSLLKSITAGCCDSDSATTTFGYDLDGQVISMRDPCGHTTLIKLDSFNRQIGTTDALGNLRRTDYDKLGNATIVRDFGPTSAGVSRLLQRTKLTYDERGQLTWISKALFQVPIPTADPWASPDAEFDQAVQNGSVTFVDTLLFFDANQRLFRYVDARGNATTFEYDGANRQISRTEPSGDFMRTTYDAASNVIREDLYFTDSTKTTRAVISTSFEFDALGRLTATTDGAGNRMTRGIDSRGLLRISNDPLGDVAKFGYNAYRDPTTESYALLPPAGGVMTELTTTTSFDSNGNVIGVADPAGNLTTFEPDSLDRLVKITNADGTSRTLGYDRCGNLISTVDEEGLTVVRRYDALNRIVGLQVNLPVSHPSSNETFATFSYDGAGNVVRHSNDFLDVTKHFDSLGRCFQEDCQLTGVLNAAVGHSLSVARKFDALANRTDLAYPSGQSLHYDFDSNNRLLRITSTSNATPYPGDPGAIAPRMILRNERWGPLLTYMTFGNGVTVSRAYDAAARRVSDDCSLTGAGHLVFQQLWTGANNRALSIESVSGLSTGILCKYDSTDRLVEALPLTTPQLFATSPFAPPLTPLPVASMQCQATMDNKVNTFSTTLPALFQVDYDGDGNRRTVITPISSVAYASNGRNEYSTVGLDTLKYDHAGRLVQDARFSYSYNYRGQLVQAVDTMGHVILRVFHDAIGRAVGIDEGPQMRAHVYDGENMLETYQGGVLSSLQFWEGQGRLCFIASGATDQFVFRDVLNSTRATTDSTGGLISAFDYDLFGTLTAGTSAPDLLYSGKYYYAPVAWYDFGVRQYIPQRGRFAQADPAGFVDGPNLYTYAGNNPLSFVDPNGTDVEQVAPAADSIPNPETVRNTFGAYDWTDPVFTEAELVYPGEKGFHRDPYGRMTYTGAVDPLTGMPPFPLSFSEYNSIKYIPKSAFHTATDLDNIVDPFPIWRDNPGITVAQANRIAMDRLLGHQCSFRTEGPALALSMGIGRLLAPGVGGSLHASRESYHVGNEAISDAAKAVVKNAEKMTTEELEDEALKYSTMRRSSVARTRSNMSDQKLVTRLAKRDASKYGPGGRTLANLFQKYFKMSTAPTVEGAVRETYLKIIMSSSRSNKLVDILLKENPAMEFARDHAIQTYFEMLIDSQEEKGGE